MAKLYDVMAPIGKYNDPNTGQEKTRWLKCGMVVQTQAGKMALKLDAMPVAPVTEEGGLWLQLFEPNQPSDNLHTANAPQGQPQGFRQQPQQPAPQQGVPAPPLQPAAPQGNPAPPPPVVDPNAAPW